MVVELCVVGWLDVVDVVYWSGGVLEIGVVVKYLFVDFVVSFGGVVIVYDDVVY